MTDSALSLIWDSTRLRLLGRDRAGRKRLRRCPGHRDRTAHRERTPPPPRNRSRTAARRAKRQGQHGSPKPDARSPLHAAQALATLRAGEEELSALAGLQAGTIHIGASTTPGVYLLPDTLGCFRRDHPNVTVEVEIASTGEIIERLLAGGVQLALVGETDADERIALDPFLCDESSGRQTRPPTPARNGSHTAASQSTPCSSAEQRSSTRQVSDQALAKAGVRPARIWELDSSEAIKRAAREGLGIAFLSHYAVAEEIERNELEHFRLTATHINDDSSSPASHADRSAHRTRLRRHTHPLLRKEQEYAAACVA